MGRLLKDCRNKMSGKFFSRSKAQMRQENWKLQSKSGDVGWLCFKTKELVGLIWDLVKHWIILLQNTNHWVVLLKHRKCFSDSRFSYYLYLFGLFCIFEHLQLIVLGIIPQLWYNPVMDTVAIWCSFYWKCFDLLNKLAHSLY